jgi:hypothetical protein
VIAVPSAGKTETPVQHHVRNSGHHEDDQRHEREVLHEGEHL